MIEKIASTKISGINISKEDPFNRACLRLLKEYVTGKIYEIACSFKGNTSIGKYTPLNNPAKLPMNKLTGSLLLNTIMNPADIIPMELKHIIDSNIISTAVRIFGLLNCIPNKNIPITRYAIILKDVNIKSHMLMPIRISEIELGVTSMASKTPDACASLILFAKVDRDVVRYAESAMPISAKEK